MAARDCLNHHMVTIVITTIKIKILILVIWDIAAMKTAIAIISHTGYYPLLIFSAMVMAMIIIALGLLPCIVRGGSVIVSVGIGIYKGIMRGSPIREIKWGVVIHSMVASERVIINGRIIAMTIRVETVIVVMMMMMMMIGITVIIRGILVVVMSNLLLLLLLLHKMVSDGDEGRFLVTISRCAGGGRRGEISRSSSSGGHY